MSAVRTEMTHAGAYGFDMKPPAEALSVLAKAQTQAAQTVEGAVPQIAAAAEIAARTIATGGRLVYAAAGSSGLMALADALELPGTYGIAKDRIHVLMAGGLEVLSNLAGAPEDDEDQARDDIARINVGAGDCVIALTASGRTPFALAAVKAARAAGATTIGMANNADAPLLELVDFAICLPTPPEVIAGSTRMGAGTAQKIALNMLSTMMATHLGHVHDGYMVNVVADNIKLKARARRIVMAVAEVSDKKAAHWLDVAEGSVKTAILLASGANSVAAADELLARHSQKLRPALAALREERG